MTQFDITYTDFKREDTTNDITIKLYADNKRPITPNSSHTWKAKVAKGDKYVGEYPVTIFGNTIKLSSSNLTRLPDGNYALELWETYDGSTAIYPSTGVMTFRVNKNLDDTLGTVDPTTDINAIIDDLHKAGQNIKVVATNTLSPGSKASVTQSITNGENQLTFNIPQGIQGEKGNAGPAPTLKIGTVTKLKPDQTPTASLSGGNGSYTLDLGIPQGVKGDTGTVDNAGLTTAPAFVNLQTQVNNSAVGTNLLTNSNFSSGLGHWTVNLGTNLDCKAVATTDSDGDACIHITGTGAMCGLWSAPVYFNQNQVTTGSVLVKGTGKLNMVGLEHRPVSNFGTISTESYSKVWSTMQAATSTNFFTVYFDPVNGVLDVYIKLVKLEIGSHATDWCPNPSEILTQADYAKIQAAIVALGGSLK